MSVLVEGKADQSICCDKPCDLCAALVDAPGAAEKLWDSLESGNAITPSKSAIISCEAGWLAGFIAGMMAQAHGGMHMHLCADHVEILTESVNNLGGKVVIRLAPDVVKH